MIYRCILPDWAKTKFPKLPKVQEGEFTEDRLEELNSSFYNIYYLPNYPSLYEEKVTVDGSHIDTFEYVFADMDLKDGFYPDKDSFVAALAAFPVLPTKVVDSGNGVHAYWRVTDLDALSFLRLQRRIIRKFHTDEAVAKIYQLMRVPHTVNTKDPDKLKLSEVLYESDAVYTCEDLDSALPPITAEDEEYCQAHYGKTYNKSNKDVKILDKIPMKFGDLLRESQEAKDIWEGNTDDRSKADYRLGHIMHGNGFTKEEATSVLVNSQKARTRAPVHRLSYAEGIVEKIWTFEMSEDKDTVELSESVKDILSRPLNEHEGEKISCWRYLDNTERGFRLGDVIGLVAGSGVGKTALALNMFMGFVKMNENYDHFFVPLEQPQREIAERWKKMCGDQTHLYEKVQILGNYDKDGGYRNLSLSKIRDYIVDYQKRTGRKVGCVVIDHIGVLKKSSKDGRQSIEDVCHAFKSFAMATNTLLVMQSQAPREKAGEGDLELGKDAAYGTVFFESYCDYLVTMWQPLKRSYARKECPTVTSYKFCKIRHKNKEKDMIQEGVCYLQFFDPNTELMREMTEAELKTFNHFNTQCVNMRKKDRKTDVGSYKSTPWADKEGASSGKPNPDKDLGTAKRA